MNFRLYDILAMLVQGILVTGTALFLFYPDYLEGVNGLYLTAVAFFNWLHNQLPRFMA